MERKGFLQVIQGISGWVRVGDQPDTAQSRQPPRLLTTHIGRSTHWITIILTHQLIQTSENAGYLKPDVLQEPEIDTDSP
jgi:hypothetical protein